ncbi:MAG: hypothetical protein WAK95_17355, partial [Desulfobacterales bacterium]
MVLNSYLRVSSIECQVSIRGSGFTCKITIEWFRIPIESIYKLANPTWRYKRKGAGGPAVGAFGPRSERRTDHRTKTSRNPNKSLTIDPY